MLTKPKNNLTNFFNNRERLDDIGIRVLLVPAFGIAIPLIVNLVPHDQFGSWKLKFSYLFTILIAWIIYEGSRILHFSLRSYFDWKAPLKKILALLLVLPFYCVPVSIILLVCWYKIFLNGQVNWEVIKLAVIIITIAVFFTVNVYETFFTVRDMAAEKISKEQLERAKAESELEALKNQIDPHFIFNSLNTLSHLIEDNPGNAKMFNDNLADVYRYILQNKARNLVLLKDEMDFLESYFSLLKMRFEDAVQMSCAVNEHLLSVYLVPPISIQLLVENAIKHNEFSVKQPLLISISMHENVLVVHNSITKKAFVKTSSKIGLVNLNERYKLLTQQSITISEDDKNFTVQLPLLKIT
ncbi:MAG: histidine kinase [Ferruginibacter sp.]